MLFYICTKIEIKILSLTEVIVFTRNGLHATYTHTHTYSLIHTNALLFEFSIRENHDTNLT